MPQASATSRGEGLDVVDDAERGADRTFRIVLVSDRSAEEREQSVAGEILDGASERLDGRDHASHGVADDELQLLGVEALAERGRPDEVGEEGGDDAAFVADVHPGILRDR